MIRAAAAIALELGPADQDAAARARNHERGFPGVVRTPFAAMIADAVNRRPGGSLCGRPLSRASTIAPKSKPRAPLQTQRARKDTRNSLVKFSSTNPISRKRFSGGKGPFRQSGAPPKRKQNLPPYPRGLPGIFKKRPENVSPGGTGPGGGGKCEGPQRI